MASRKRNKGKNRKAKARAAAAERSSWWFAWARSRENREVERNHGCGPLPEPGSAVYRFMDGIEGVAFGNDVYVREWMADTVQQHHQVWTDATLRKSAIDVMLRMGTNAILSDRGETETRSIALVLANAILPLEHYKGQSDLRAEQNLNMAYLISVAETRDVTGGGERDMLRFYAKRITCSCLEGKHSQAKKSLPKTGECDHCKSTKERKSLMVCYRCKLFQYCCRECQVADSPEHKSICDYLVSLKDEYGQN